MLRARASANSGGETKHTQTRSLRHSYESFAIGEGYVQDTDDEPQEEEGGACATSHSTLSKLYKNDELAFEPEGAFSVFPKELCVYIFDFLDWRTLCKAACVCSAWHALFEDYKTPLLAQREQKHTSWVLYLLSRALDQIEEIIHEQKMAKKREIARRRHNNLMERRRREFITSYMPTTGEGSDFYPDSNMETSPSSTTDDATTADDDNDKEKEFDMHSRTGTRIEFLKATILLLKEYFEKGAKAKQEEQEAEMTRNFTLQKTKPMTALPEYVHLLAIVNRQLLETTEILVQVKAGRITLNANFDIIELSLRRYYAHFVLMFSPTGQASSLFEYPSEMIHDLQARQIWNTYVGQDKYFVDFERFYDDVLSKEIQKHMGSVNEEYKYYMKYFLNFPKDDTVTVSKWNLLTRLFGPYKHFFSNFTKYVLGHGFLGLINRIRAEEILKDHPHCVLIRFSRTAPLVLAFSVSRGNKIQHYTNAPSQRAALGLPESKENIPINVFLSQQFPDASLVPMRVDGRLVATKETLSHYCEQVAGYEVMS